MTSDNGGIHKILNIFIQTKLEEKTIPFDKNPLEVIRLAEDENKVHRFRKDIFFCCFKTEFEKEPAVICVFTMKLPGPISGSSASSEIVMNVISFMEKLLSPIDKIEFSRNLDYSSKNIALLTIIKKISEEL